MACLKCGKENEEGLSFCPDCRNVMQRYPVDPGIAVHIPKRPTVPEERKAPRKMQRAEETERLLRSIIRYLAATIGVLTIIICVLVGILLNTMQEKPETSNFGQNYTFVDPNAPKDTNTSPTWK